MVSFDEPAAMAEEASGGARALRRADVQGQGRPRARARRRGHARDPRRAPRRGPLRRRQPRLELRRRAARRRRADRARRARDRGADLGRRPGRPPAPGRALDGAARRRRELHQPRARRPRARGGRGARGEHQDRAHGLHRVAPDPRPVPRARDVPVVVGSQYEGAIGALATIALRGRVRRHRGPAGRDHELPRPRRRPRRPPRRRSATAAPRCRTRPASASRSTRSAWQRYRVDG